MICQGSVLLNFVNTMPTLKIPMSQFNHNFLFNLKQQSAATSKYYSLFRQSVSN